MGDISSAIKARHGMGIFNVPDEWHGVFVMNWRHVESAWIADNLEGQYVCRGHFWYFEKQQDAALFKLRWL
jgi:hypothetical protein